MRHISSTFRLGTAPRCFRADQMRRFPEPTNLDDVTCPDCVAWLETDAGAAWTARWASVGRVHPRTAPLFTVH